MRLGFTGASGQGKTSTAERLLDAPEFVHFKFIRSTSRVAEKHGYSLNESATKLSQLLITNSRIAAEAQYKGHSYLSERTPLDSLAYTSVVGAREHWDEYYLSVSEQIVESYMSRYEYIFYFPLKLRVQGDRFRSSDPKFHEEVDTAIRYYLQEFRIPYITLKSDKIDERVDEIRFKLYGRRYK